MVPILLFSLLALSPAADLPAPGTNRVVLIDQAWLTQRGAGPYVLDQPQTTYLLKTDLRVLGTAFVITAPDLVLDLGGHQVVHGDGEPLTVHNSGFEEGSGRNVPGWDLTGAPAAEMGPNTHYLFGKQVLRLKDFRSTQRIVSSPVAIPATQHTHVATITPAAGDYRTTLTLTVVDAETGHILGQGKSNNVERGISAVAHFQPAASRGVRLVIEVTPGAGRADNLDLDEATVSASFDYGILASNTWTGEIPGWSNLDGAVGKLPRQVANFTLRNGAILQGRGRGLGCSPLLCTQVRGMTVENVETFTTGMDTTTLDAGRAGGPIVVRHCKLRHEVKNITDRGKLFAALRLAAVQGAIDIEDNDLHAVPQVGILLDGAVSGAPVHIRNNRIEQRAVVTNGYGLIIVGSRNFEISQNKIIAENGRGIDIDSYRKEPVEHGEIHHNHVEAREGLNRESWQRLETRALRLRNTVDGKGPHRDLFIHDNTFIAVTGDGLSQKAFAVRITYQNADGSMKGANVRLERNRLRAVTTSTDPNSHASALALDGLDPGVDLRLQDNVLESNDSALTLADSEGSVDGAILLGNTFRHLAEGAARPFHAIHAGFWVHKVQNVRVIGTRLENHGSLDIDWAGSGPKDVAVAYLLDLRVQDNGGPIPDASVSIEDREGKQVFKGKTDRGGVIHDILLVTTEYHQTTPDPRRATTEERGPFRVRVLAGNRTITEEFTLTGNRRISVQLPGN